MNKEIYDYVLRCTALDMRTDYGMYKLSIYNDEVYIIDFSESYYTELRKSRKLVSKCLVDCDLYKIDLGLLDMNVSKNISYLSYSDREKFHIELTLKNVNKLTNDIFYHNLDEYQNNLYLISKLVLSDTKYIAPDALYNVSSLKYLIAPNVIEIDNDALSDLENLKVLDISGIKGINLELLRSLYSLECVKLHPDFIFENIEENRDYFRNNTRVLQLLINGYAKSDKMNRFINNITFNSKKESVTLENLVILEDDSDEIKESEVMNEIRSNLVFERLHTVDTFFFNTQFRNLFFLNLKRLDNLFFNHCFADKVDLSYVESVDGVCFKNGFIYSLNLANVSMICAENFTNFEVEELILSKSCKVQNMDKLKSFVNDIVYV